MKRILQALDNTSTKPVEGANDMKKFLQVVTEGTNPHKVSLPVQMAMQHFQQPAPVIEKKPSLLRQYFAETEEAVAEQLAEEESVRRQRINMYAQKIANKVLMKESTLSERVLPGQEVEPGINRLTGKPIEPETPSTPVTTTVPLSSRYGPGYEGSPEAYSITVSGKNYKFAGRDKTGPGTGPVIKVPGGAVGIRGLAPVSVELGNDGMFYTAPVTNEAPIEMTGDPNDPNIYGHEKANPMSLKGRIMSARAQLKDLAERAESNDLLVWQGICRDAKGGMFMGLEQNLEQIRHGIAELAAKRKQGGIQSRGIDKNISEMSVSQKQARTMAAAAHNPKFAKKVGIKQSVAKEFNKADTGTKQLSQAMKKK